MSENIKANRVAPDQATSFHGRINAWNNSVAQGDVVSIVGVNSGGSYLTIQLAKDTTTITESQQLIAAHPIPSGTYGRVEPWQIVDLDTSGDTIGDLVYLSAVTPGAVTTTAPAGTPPSIGKVLTAAVAGKVLLRPLV